MVARSFQRFGLILALGLIISIGFSLTAAPVSRAQTPTPNLFVTTTAVVNDQNDGKCDLSEALQAIVQANIGMSPTYHECTALANQPTEVVSKLMEGLETRYPSNV